MEEGEIADKEHVTVRDIRPKRIRIIKKAKMEKGVMVKYTTFGKINDLNIVAYTDSSYKNDVQKVKSVGEKLTALCNKEGNCDPLIWKSKTIHQACKSVKMAKHGV